MIYTQLKGGLGNQLFQYASGRAAASRTGANLILDCSWFGRISRYDTPRQFELHRYPIEARIANDKETRICKLHSHPILGRLGIAWGGVSKMTEQSSRQLQIHEVRTGKVYLEGYWQKHRYFDPIKPELERTIAVPTSALSTTNKQIAEMISASQSVAMHIRRGDYVSNPLASRIHAVCSPEYYERALEKMTELCGPLTPFVFSDDIGWVRAHVRLPRTTIFVTKDAPGEPHEELELMRRCRTHIIANSTFSWWGAYLGANSEQVVIAPRKWFKDARAVRELVPETWISI